MKKLALFISLLFLARLLGAQSDSAYTFDYLDRSTRFAWTTLGGDLMVLSGGNVDFLNNKALGNTDFGNTFVPRLTIGGVHFWGHADFYVTFPLNFLAFRQKPEGFNKLVNTQGIETGARIYPWRLKPNTLRPFAGISFQLKTYGHQTEGNSYVEGNPEFDRIVSPLQFGLTYTTDKYLVTLSSYYQFLRETDYYLSPGQTGRLRFDPLSFNLSFLRYWDTDRSMRTPRALQQENLKDAILRKERRMSTWYWGVGPSGALQTSRSPFLDNQFPFLYDDFIGGFMPDLSFGRFLEKPDMNLGLSFRSYGTTLRGFDTRIGLRRHSFMLEGYKNLFNWLGFVPFLGVTGSVELLSTDVNGTVFRETKPAIGLIFGWDIRVTKTGTNLLRTNLRWIPNLHMEIEGEKMMFNHLEFNFIQWVQFIGRGKVYQRYRGNK